MHISKIYMGIWCVCTDECYHAEDYFPVGFITTYWAKKKKKLFLIKIKGSNECDGKKNEFWEV